MQDKRNPPTRSRGTGALFIRKDAAGRETYYGKWRTAGGGQVKKRLGPKRIPRTRDGLTVTQAEAELRRRMGEVTATAIAKDQRVTLSEAIEAHLTALENTGLKRSTAGGYRSIAKAHFGVLAERPVDGITEADVAALDRKLRKSGLSPQTRRNVLGLLGAVLARAKRKGWTLTNPLADYEKPAKPRSETNGELAYLTLEEVEAVLRAMPDDPFGRVERAIVLAAAMTGMRRGELLGLRWRDVLWEARKLDVVRTWVGGREDTPKSKESRRTVPLADRLAGELQRLYDATPFKADDDPVFTHPLGTGLPLDGSAVSKSFKRALKRAGVREVRFHDLRHTFGTMMAAHPEVSMRTLQGWLGHADPATTAIYAHAKRDDHAAELVEQAFAAPAAVEGVNV